ncbi:lasso RiPP family leader peptide-containing protein [Natrarchaeobius chitinivorans]|nr:lasso RiPP family leader peptide-containing protein [Natrarchaeobius chitinivorans]
MSERNSKRYEAPELTEYGTVESITQQDKVGTGDDQWSDGTPLTGSVF